jgi:hypothetical protein
MAKGAWHQTELVVSDTMAFRQNVVRKSARPPLAAGYWILNTGCWLLPLLGEWSLGEREDLAMKNTKKVRSLR